MKENDIQPVNSHYLTCSSIILKFIATRHNLGGKDGKGNRFREQEQEFSWGPVKFEMSGKYPNGDVK